MTLFIHVVDRIKVKDIVPRLVRVIRRVLKQIHSVILHITQKIHFMIRGTRAPPGEIQFIRVLKKGAQRK